MAAYEISREQLIAAGKLASETRRRTGREIAGGVFPFTLGVQKPNVERDVAIDALAAAAEGLGFPGKTGLEVA